MPSIITISSHVAHGAVGNRIIVPALEALGISVTAVSTVELAWHPGMNAAYGKGPRIVPDDAAFAGIMGALCGAPWLAQTDAIISGYLGSAAQAEAIANLVQALKKAKPNALYLCDPVIGDNGGLYVPETTANAIRDRLWPLADIVTPNLFEFGWITGQTSPEVNRLAETAKTLSKRDVIVTSAHKHANSIGSLLVSADKAIVISHQAISPTPNGTGDLLAALFLGQIVKGALPADALHKAASTVVAAIKQANHVGGVSLAPEYLYHLLVADWANVQIEPG